MNNIKESVNQLLGARSISTKISYVGIFDRVLKGGDDAGVRFQYHERNEQ
jgi:hypothetical protein